MNVLLRLKHWQLFLFFVGLPFGIEEFVLGGNATSQDLTWVNVFLSICLIVYMGVYYGWLYVLGINLHKRLPFGIKMNLPLFKLFLGILCAYLLVVVLVINVLLNGSPQNEESLDTGIIGLMIPLHLVCICCHLYCINFTAKILKAVESRKPVSFVDSLAELLLICLFPIGVWIIQPRINSLFRRQQPGSSKSI